MKTLEQILEGVTAGGKWHAELRWLDSDKQHLAYFAGAIAENADAAFAARAARSFEPLVHAVTDLLALVERIDKHVGLQTEERTAVDAALQALAEALKE